MILNVLFCLIQITGSPDPITISQPDGTKIDVIGKGNMYVSYTETLDGYTLVMNKHGIYEYGILNKATGDIIPSGFKAHNLSKRTKKEKIFLKKIKKHINYQSPKLDSLLREQKNKS